MYAEIGHDGTRAAASVPLLGSSTAPPGYGYISEDSAAVVGYSNPAAGQVQAPQSLGAAQGHQLQHPQYGQPPQPPEFELNQQVPVYLLDDEEDQMLHPL
jgi:hypothetical protein